MKDAACVCVLYACGGGGAERGRALLAARLALDLLEREDVTYKIDFTVAAGGSLSS